MKSKDEVEKCGEVTVLKKDDMCKACGGTGKAKAMEKNLPSMEGFQSLATNPVAKPLGGPRKVKLPGSHLFGVGSTVQGVGAKPGPNMNPSNPGPKLPKPPGI